MWSRSAVKSKFYYTENGRNTVIIKNSQLIRSGYKHNSRTNALQTIEIRRE